MSFSVCKTCQVSPVMEVDGPKDGFLPVVTVTCRCPQCGAEREGGLKLGTGRPGEPSTIMQALLAGKDFEKLKNAVYGKWAQEFGEFNLFNKEVKK